jgi:energy-coupling factor transporter ATP-binding protein EcfA2
MSNKYKFKILREEVEVEDFYEEKTHENIKCSLLDLIKNEKEGITIGLSGQWGSGKSTIINLLQKEKEYVFFYFDAWAHEGDPLRRIFLESFINCLKGVEIDENKIINLEEKRTIISREKRTKTIKITRSTTKLGLLLTVTTFILSIGLALLSSINFDNITTNWTGSISLVLYLGTLFALSPFFVLAHNYYKLKNEKLDINDLKNWAFLQNNSDETITEDVTGEDERSSIEFERYFKEILEIFNSEKPKKIILVLDNLDRVDAEVSLKIWSTLQTFIQFRNPTAKDYKIFKNIFTLIPYDEESLMKIWENFTENEEGKKVIDNSFARSFFDKSFQVRIDVPKPIVSNWLGFIEKMIEKAFEDWDKKEKDVIIEVIEKTRKTILDNPKPREIKTYLNQVGFLRNHFSEDISTKSIAFYTYKRYLQGKSNDEIADYLLKIDQIPKEEINLIEEDTIQELAAIIYGVNKDKGAQVLLTPKIVDALTNNKPEILSELIVNYNNVFWSIFKKIISDTNNFSNYLRYSSPINNCLNELNSHINSDFITLFAKYLNNEKERNYLFDDNFGIDINNASDLFLKYSKQDSIKKLWSFFINVFEFQESKNDAGNEINDKRNIIFLNTLNHISDKTKIEFGAVKLNIGFTNWRLLNKEDMFINISKFIHPSNLNLNETSGLIREGSKIDDETNNLIRNYVNSNVLKLESLVIQLQKHIKWNNGSKSGDSISFNSIELFEMFFFKYKNYDFSNLLKGVEIYSVCHFTSSENVKATSIMATICAIYYKDKILLIKNEIPQTNSYSNAFIDIIINYWITSDINNAQFTYEKLRKNKSLKLVWEFCTDENNKLCLDIIDIMIKNEDNNDFKLDNPFEILVAINAIKKEGFDVSNLVNKFFEHSDLETSFLNLEEIEIDANDYVIYELLDSNKSKEIFKKIESVVQNLDNEILKDSLNNDDYLFNILLQVKEENIEFTLGSALNETLYEFVKGSLLKNSTLFNIAEWQINNWSNIINLLDETFYENFCDRITKLVVDEKENIKDEFFELNKEFLNKNLIIDLINKEINQFKLYVQEALQNPPNIDKIKFIGYIIKLDTDKKISFGRGFKDLIKDNIVAIHQNESSDELKSITLIIANRLSIKVEN